MSDPQVYIHSDIYYAAIDALEAAALAYDPETPEIDLRSRLIEALGCVGGVWPISIYSGQDECAALVTTQ